MRKAYRLATALLGAALLTPDVASAQCVRGPASCNDVTGPDRRICSASVMCNGFLISTSADIRTTMATNATCLPTTTNFSTPVTLSVMATVNFPLPTTAACNWYWQSYSASMTGNFSITGPMDGLPVELLEFSVVED